MFCPFCEYEWSPKVESPKECPNCKRYLPYGASNARSVANSKISEALNGNIIKKPDACQKCGISGKRLNAHHADYLKPFEIEWLCQKCHLGWHSKNGPGLNRDAEVPVMEAAQVLGLSRSLFVGSYPKCTIRLHHQFIENVCKFCGFCRLKSANNDAI